MRQTVITQLDIFGGETVICRPRSEFQEFRIRNQYRKSVEPERRCRTCKYLLCRMVSRNIYKCELMGITHSSASDVRAGGVCERYEKLNERIRRK